MSSAVVVPGPDRDHARGQGIVTIHSAAAAVLWRPALEVERVDRKIRKLVTLMHREMFLAGGVGLAAPQVARSLRVFVYDDRAGHRGAVVNPALTLMSDEEIVEREGCLSVPDDWRPVARAWAVYLEGVDERDEPVSIEAEGFLARIFQHEFDHLFGRLLTDRSPS